MIKVCVSTIFNNATIELIDFLDEKGITYEVEKVGTEWVGSHKVKSLPVVEIDGEILSMKKIMKRLKKTIKKYKR